MPIKALIKKLEAEQVYESDHIAVASLEGIKELVHKSKATKAKELLKELQDAKKQLEGSLLTEPCMRNALKFLFYDLPSKDILDLTKEVCERIDAALAFFTSANDRVAKRAEKIFKNGAAIFTHSNFSSVNFVLTKAKQDKKRFSVLVPETRPFLQGRTFALNLSKQKIPTTLFVDGASKSMMKGADLVILGCDAITNNEIFSTMGGELVALLAKKYDIPVYILANSWKYDPFHIAKEGKYQERPAKEVWEKPPIGVKVSNHMYEKIDPNLVDGIISELGILQHDDFLHAVKEKYPWVSKH